MASIDPSFIRPDALARLEAIAAKVQAVRLAKNELVDMIEALGWEPIGVVPVTRFRWKSDGTFDKIPGEMQFSGEIKVPDLGIHDYCGGLEKSPTEPVTVGDIWYASDQDC